MFLSQIAYQSILCHSRKKMISSLSIFRVLLRHKGDCVSHEIELNGEKKKRNELSNLR